MVKLGMRIRELREQRKWSQETLGRKVDRSKSVICSYETGLKVPPLEVLVQLSAIFHVSLDYLAGLEREERLELGALRPEQRRLLEMLAEEFQSPSAPAEELSPRQNAIISGLFREFCRRP